MEKQLHRWEIGSKCPSTSLTGRMGSFCTSQNQRVMGSLSPLQSLLFVISLLGQHSSVLCVLNRATSPTQTLTRLEKAQGPLKTKHPICTFFMFKIINLSHFQLRWMLVAALGFLLIAEWGLLSTVTRGLRVSVASLVEQGLQKRRLSSCGGAQAQLLCGMWDPLRPGTERVPCVGRRTPIHCTARDVHICFVLFISKGTLLKFILSQTF